MNDIAQPTIQELASAIGPVLKPRKQTTGTPKLKPI